VTYFTVPEEIPMAYEPRVPGRVLSRARPCGAALILAAALAACGGGGGGGGASAPAASVSISVAPTTIVLGQSATVTWNASSGTSCTASGAWSGAQGASGTQTVTPTTAGTQTYTLACGGGTYGGSTTKSATLTVTQPTAYTATALVADTAGTALVTDPNLKNAWGIAFGPTTFVWTANNHTDTSTLYDGNGQPQPHASPLVAQLPTLGSGASFDPTGIVFNGSADFVVTANNASGPSAFIFTGEGGAIAGWSPAVDFQHAVLAYTDTGGAVYKGLAIANNGTANFIYATDFHNGKVDVFNASFQKQASATFPFTDPNLPAGYAPFGIQAVATGTGGAAQIVVTYAVQQGPDNVDDTPGAGLGVVDLYDANGALVKRLVSPGGALNAPWGVALAPSDFGTWSGALLVGNFGDGTINAFDASSGALLGTLKDGNGAAIAIPGLWGIAFGNDKNNQPHNTLFYAAGPNSEANGLYGRLDVGSTPPLLNQPPTVAVTAPTGSVHGTVAVTASVQSPLSIAKVEFFLNGTTSLGTATAAPYSVQWDTTAVADGPVTLTAVATDADGNAGTSAAASVTVANAAANAPTLTQLQANIFTPKCSGCHDGSQPASGSLPGAQNLSAGNTWANVVNVASKEQPSLMRVKPGDPANSYLIQKLEGAASISGSRMPLGGPYLDQATIDQVKAWIAAGAQNN
jgi:uncharacterized protein (TIGR03118 family)